MCTNNNINKQTHIELFNVSPFNYTWFVPGISTAIPTMVVMTMALTMISVLLLFDIYSNEWMINSFYLFSQFCLFVVLSSFIHFFKSKAQLFIIYNMIKREERKNHVETVRFSFFRLLLIELKNMATLMSKNIYCYNKDCIVFYINCC